MKKLLLLLFIPIVCLSQNDFRKMNWGESTKSFEEKYLNVDFEEYEQGLIKVYTQEGFVSGYDTLIRFFFIDNEFSAGSYHFSYKMNNKDSKDYIKDFYFISDFLNDKYDMKRSDKWYDDGYKNSPEKLDFALYLGEVELIEKYSGDDKDIKHFLGEEEKKLVHKLTYYSPKHNTRIDSMVKDDF